MTVHDTGYSGISVNAPNLDQTNIFHQANFAAFPSASSFTANAFMMDDSTGALYKNISSVWTRVHWGKGKAADQVYPLDTTIGDYSTPSYLGAGSVSSGISVGQQEGALKLGNGSSSGAGFSANPAEERGFRLNGISGSPALKTCKVILRKVGTPTGNMQLEVFNNITGSRPTGAVVTNGTSGTLDVSTLTTSFAVYTFTWSTAPTVSSSHWVVLHFTGGDNSNYVEIGGLTSSVDNPCWALDANHSGDYFNSPASDDIVFTAYDSTPALLDQCTTGGTVRDGSTSSTWTSDSQNNPWIEIDTGAAQEVVALAINLDRTATTETQFKIRFSTDRTYSDVETVRVLKVTDFTDDTWRFIVIPRQDVERRYFQIFGTSNSVILSINEIKYIVKTGAQFDRFHYHAYIDPTRSDQNELDSN